jgi:nitroreductase
MRWKHGMRFVLGAMSGSTSRSRCLTTTWTVSPRPDGGRRRRKNRQAWDFVIVTDKAQLQELSTVWQGAGHIAGAAAAIAFVLPVPPSERRKV